MNKQELTSLCQHGYTQREIAKKFNVSQKKVRNWLKKYSIKLQRKPYYGRKMQQYFDARILRLHNYGYRKISSMIGISPQTIMHWVSDLPSNPCIAYQLRDLPRRKTLNEATGRHTIRRELIKQRGYKCEECKRTTWRGQPIPLHVHHIDGNKKNNKLHNLKILCLNCHGLTKNFCAKKRLRTLTGKGA